MNVGPDFNPEWIEREFQTNILPYCESEGEGDYGPAQNAFLNCLREGLTPRASAELLKEKLDALLKQRTDAQQPLQRTLACINYLNSRIHLMGE